MLGDIYQLASNPTRRRILLSLLQGEKSFSDLMRSISMDPEHDTGPFLYHMHRLEGVGLVLSNAGKYSLTSSGVEASEALILVHHVLGRANENTPRLKPCLEANEDYVAGSQHEGGKIMKRENEDLTTDLHMTVGLLEEDDVESVLEVLYHLDFYQKQIDHMRQHLTKMAARGLDRYENNFVAHWDGRAIARMVVDTNYPPYAELAGLVVHPSYRELGVGKALTTHFTEFATERKIPIQYVMVETDNHMAQNLYRGFGFEAAILVGFHEKGHEICMFRFGEGSLPFEFRRKHPLSQLRTSSDTCGEVPIGKMEWTDPLTESRLLVQMKGKRHLSMPRVSRILLDEGGVSLDLQVEEETKSIGPDREGVFRITAINNGKAVERLSLRLVLPQGIETCGPHEPRCLKLGIASQKEVEFHIRMGSDFKVPALSFTTVLITCIIDLGSQSAWDSPASISAGFENTQYSKTEVGS